MVFNENSTAKNVTINPGDTLDEGERDKVIQRTTNNVEDVEEQEETENQDVEDNKINQKPEETHQNTIVFPSTPKKPQDNNINQPDEQLEEEIEPQNYRRGHCARSIQGDEYWTCCSFGPWFQT